MKKALKITTIILGAVILLIILAVSTESPADKKKEAEKAIAEKTVDAYSMSQQFLKDQLKAPSTAKFPDYSDDQVKYTGDSIFAVTSHVDAENAFSAMLRIKYACRVKYSGADKWILLEMHTSEDSD